MVDQIAKVTEIQVPGAMGPAWIEGEVATYDPETSYAPGQGVLFENCTFRALQASIGQTPVVIDDVAENSPYWGVVAQGGVSLLTEAAGGGWNGSKEQLRKAVAGRGRFGNKFDPLNYGVTPGSTGNAATDLTRATNNRLAFQQCADAFVSAIRAGDRSATFVFPNNDFLIAAARYNGANWLDGQWTSHGIVFNADIWGGSEVIGGRIVGEGGRIIRVENETDIFGSSGDSSNSTILVMGKWRDLKHTGLVELEGYQVDSQSGGERGVTSGDGWQFSFGVQYFSAERLWGWKGTNAGFAINMNKRAVGSSSAGGIVGFDMRDEMICKHFDLTAVTTWNGEHGGLINSAHDVHIGSMIVRQRAYTYGGVSQGSYQQRGLYLLNANRIRADSLDIDGVDHVGLFCTVYDASRTAYDLDVSIGKLRVTFAVDQDDDPDRHAAFEMQNSNNGVGAIRTISLQIQEIEATGLKTLAIWRESNIYVSEAHRVLKKFSLGRISGLTNSHGIYLKPRGGAGDIIIGSGVIRVLTNPLNDALPNDGLLVQAGADFDKAVAEASPVTLATLNGYTYHTGSGTPPANYIKPGNIKRVSDWPGGAATVIYDPMTAGTWSSPTAWRLLTTPGRIDSISIGLDLVEASNSPMRLSGSDVLNLLGTRVNYVNESVAGADSRCVKINRIGGYGDIRYNSSDGLFAEQTYAQTYVPAPIFPRQPRVFTRDFSSVAANTASSYVDYTCVGARTTDRWSVAPRGDIGGLVLDAYCNTNDNVRVKVKNPTNAAVDLPSMDFLLSGYGVLA